MAISPEFIEQLLHEDESPSLDFKSQQYSFEGATNGEKAELLKDVLALANSWRRSTGYILVGVDEARGGRSHPTGVSEHLDDAKLQQFINSKTQRPVEFSYQELPIEGVDIGVIGVPVQQRPFYLLKDYGGLSAQVVYLRRGSSTDRASPDEIASMGRSLVAPGQLTPRLDFQVARFGERRPVGSSLCIEVEDLRPLAARDYTTGGGMYDAMTNRDYLRQLVEYVRINRLVAPMGVLVGNAEGPSAEKVEWRARVVREDDLMVLSEADLPDRPSTSSIVPVGEHLRSFFQESPVSVDRLQDHWEVRVRFGDILPGDTAWAAAPVFVGGAAPTSVAFHGHLFAANLPNPLQADVVVEINASSRDMAEADLRPFMIDDDAF